MGVELRERGAKGFLVFLVHMYHAYHTPCSIGPFFLAKWTGAPSKVGMDPPFQFVSSKATRFLQLTNVGNRSRQRRTVLFAADKILSAVTLNYRTVSVFDVQYIWEGDNEHNKLKFF